MKKILVLLVVLGLAGIASAVDSIGVNLGSNEASLNASDWAGVWSQPNWNNAPNGGGSLTDVKDDGGAATTADASWSSWGTWHCTAHGTATGDAKLMYGYLDPVWGDWSATITISQIPYAQYNVIAYVGTNNNGATSHVTDGTTTYSYTVAYPINTPFTAANYLQTTATDESKPVANYAVFAGKTGSSVTISTNTYGNGGGLFGVQIVEVPEPMTMALLGLGGLGLIRRRHN